MTSISCVVRIERTVSIPIRLYRIFNSDLRRSPESADIRNRVFDKNSVSLFIVENFSSYALPTYGLRTMPNEKIYPRNQLVEIVQRLKADGKVVVTTNGCFDVLHVGHLRYLQAAQALGDILVVGVNSDDSVRVLKGENRPLVPADERAEMLAGLGCVDYVTIFPELDPIDLLSAIKPNIHIKGGDYTIERVIEREAVESNGGKVILGLNVPGKSTTDLIETIRDRYNSPRC